MKSILTSVLFMSELFFATVNAQEITITTTIPTNITQANNNFAFAFYNKISNSENIFFSPFSIYLTFAMTYEGSDGITKKEFQKVFNLPPETDTIRQEFNLLIKNLKANKENLIKIANSIWAQKEYKFLPSYIEILKNHYFSDVFNSDFKTDPEKERERINLWVQENTNNKIIELIPPQGLDTLTRLVLVNAIYFKGLWENQFDKNLTFSDYFIKDKKEIPVKMMTYPQEIQLPYYQDEKLQMIELPYKNKSFSMYIILPQADNTKEVEKDLSYENFTNWTKNMVVKKIKVFIPKLKVEYFSKLNEILTQMGLKTAFTQKADFSKMDNTRKLYIQKAFHKARIEIDEEGSQAQAATAVAIGLKAVMITPVFKVNKPFIFLITDKKNNLILFMGKVSNPQS